MVVTSCIHSDEICTSGNPRRDRLHIATAGFPFVSGDGGTLYVDKQHGGYDVLFRDVGSPVLDSINKRTGWKLELRYRYPLTTEMMSRAPR